MQVLEELRWLRLPRRKRFRLSKDLLGLFQHRAVNKNYRKFFTLLSDMGQKDLKEKLERAFDLYQDPEVTLTAQELLVFWIAFLYLWQPRREQIEELTQDYATHPVWGFLLRGPHELSTWLKMLKGLSPKERRDALPEDMRDRAERKQAFGRLRELRRGKHLTQAEVAERAGLNRQEISRLERGELHSWSPQERLRKLRAYMRGLGFKDKDAIDGILTYTGIILYALLDFRVRGPGTKPRKRKARSMEHKKT